MATDSTQGFEFKLTRLQLWGLTLLTAIGYILSLIHIFNSSEKYTKEPVYAVVIPVDQEVIEWSVPDLPFGEYAIAVYHDKNTNGKLDTNFLGMPKESYGFSNNARGKFGPASWKDAKFEVKDYSFTHQIMIK